MGVRKVYSEEPNESAFIRFIDGSIQVGASMGGSFGVLLKYKNSVSVYKSTNVDTYEDPINTILIKFIPINNETQEKEFNSEVEIQTDIYDRTKDGLEPLCPAILFSGIFDKRTPLMQSFITKSRKHLISLPQYIGIVAMEFMEYTTMYHLLEKIKGSQMEIAVYMAAAFLLIDLAYKTGYTQGDFHFKNILFKIIPETEEYPYFLVDTDFPPVSFIKRLKPLIIDFGRAKKINVPEMTEMHAAYNFRQILGHICAQGCGNTDYNHILYSPARYGWASGLNKSIVRRKDKDDRNEEEEQKYLEELEHENNNKLQEYLTNLHDLDRDPRLTFFKNASSEDINFHLVNLEEEGVNFLNEHFDGENGIMMYMIAARNKSNDKIAKFKKYIAFKDNGGLKNEAEEFKRVFEAIKPQRIADKPTRELILQIEDLQIEELINGIENLPLKNPIKYINMLITTANELKIRYGRRFPLDTQVKQFIENMIEYLTDLKTKLGATVELSATVGGRRSRKRTSQRRKRTRLKRRKPKPLFPY